MILKQMIFVCKILRTTELRGAQGMSLWGIIRTNKANISKQEQMLVCIGNHGAYVIFEECTLDCFYVYINNL